MQNSKFLFILSTFLCLFIIIVYGTVLSKTIICNKDNCVITIPRNSSLSQVAQIFEDSFSIKQNHFKISMYMTFNQDDIKYGRYDLSHIKNLRDLINMITSSKSERVKVTILEGWKIQDIALYLESKLSIDVEKFIYLCYDNELIKQLSLDTSITSLEGFLFPDTYILLKSYTERDIIKILINQYKKEFNSIKPDNVLLDEYDTITLASIIQAESRYKTDMDTIASVFYNRLNNKEYLRLEADPTIQYLLPKPKERLMYKDIFDDYKDSPYNTYTHEGLPPTPINNPGLDAINATLYPPDTDYYFFVADGKGKHTFSRSIKEHNRAKAKYNASRKSK